MAATAPPVDDAIVPVTPPPAGIPTAVEEAPTPAPAEAEQEVKPDPLEKEAEDVMEAIMPSAEPVERKLMHEDGEQVIAVYTQKPLSYFRKMQFFRLLAKGLKKAIDDGGPEVVADLFGGPLDRSIGGLSQADFDDAGQFMNFVLSIVEQAPDIIEDAYVIWLAVPPGQREWAKAAMRGDLEGVEPLSDEEGVDILKVFIAQNWSAMQAFFKVHAKEVTEVAKNEQRRISQDEQ